VSVLILGAAALWRLPESYRPIAAYENTIDLGEHEFGDIVTAPFSIANIGASDLVIDEISSSCSSTGFRILHEGQHQVVERLCIKPGDQRDLTVKLVVKDIPINANFVNKISFRTNDPVLPNGAVRLLVKRVHGGIDFYPKTVYLGSIGLHASHTQQIEIRDRALIPRKITSIKIPEGSKLNARVIEAHESSGVPAKKPAPQQGHLVGFLEITVDTSCPRDINAKLEFALSDGRSKPDTLQVIGGVRAPIEVSHSSLYLPVYTPAGPLYETTLSVTSTTGKNVELKLLTLPNHFDAEVLPATQPSSKKVRIKLQSKQVASEVNRVVMTISAKTEDYSSMFDIPIIVIPGQQE
jgi:hypothetical protein